MKRLATLAAWLGAVPAFAADLPAPHPAIPVPAVAPPAARVVQTRYQEPAAPKPLAPTPKPAPIPATLPPAAPIPATMPPVPVHTGPYVPGVPAPAVIRPFDCWKCPPLPMCPTVGPVTVDCHGVVGGCPEPCRTSHPLGRVLAAVPRPAIRRTGACPADRGALLDRLRTWACWQPAFIGVGHMRPTPYHAPVRTYLPCKESGSGPSAGCGPAARPARRTGGLFDFLRPTRGGTAGCSTGCQPPCAPTGCDPVAPGLRFANPMAAPAPSATHTTGAAAHSTGPATQVVVPVATPLVSRPFTNP